MALLRRLLVYVAVSALLLLLGVQMGLIERLFIYFPEAEVVGTPADWGMAYEEASLTASDGVRLHGWLVPGEKRVGWIWLHSNGGNVGHRLEQLKLLHDALGVTILLFDYRGYGRSEGAPSEEGTYRDAEAALAYLRSRPEVDPERIVYNGHSLGAPIAAELAARHPPYALVLESPIDSVPQMARRAYPLLPPLGPLLRTKYDTVAKMRSLTRPLLVLHGDLDELVPIEAGRQVFEAAAGPKEFFTVRGAGHNDLYATGGEEYLDALRRFLAGLE